MQLKEEILTAKDKVKEEIKELKHHHHKHRDQAQAQVEIRKDKNNQNRLIQEVKVNLQVHLTEEVINK